ncbi:hypothetical protein [Azospirillum sp. B4]|uniref:hypothetical protein n=1 Tax=Azospirillum sp. B4 TaxID=95605 RepID=UPI0011DD8FD1|nr:hypothetical protein [Azospirillum sp. B4]
MGTDAMMEVFAMATGRNLSSAREMSAVRKVLREEKSDGHVHIITVVYLYAVGGLGLLCLAILFFHFLTPETWHFLKEDQIVKIQELLLSGGAGAFIERSAKKIK